MSSEDHDDDPKFITLLESIDENSFNILNLLEDQKKDLEEFCEGKIKDITEQIKKYKDNNIDDILAFLKNAEIAMQNITFIATVISKVLAVIIVWVIVMAFIYFLKS